MGRKKSRLVPLVMAAVMIMMVPAVLGLASCVKPEVGYEQNIAKIETSTQQIGGATVTNYMPLLAENVDWDNLSDKEREGTARCAVGLATEKAATAGAQSFNVLGQSANNRQTVFLYVSGEATITLFIGDEYVSIPLEE